MSVPEVRPAGEALRSGHVKPLCGRTVTVVSTFLSAISFALVGAPVASATPVSAADHTQSGPTNFDCRGQTPGWCPPHRHGV